MAFPPTPVPTTPTILTPGQYYAPSSVSGMSPASGQSGSFSGPSLIEEQSLNFNYCRVPEALYSSVSYGLSSYSQNMSVGQTILALQVWAYYSRQKSYETFDTSSWQQNQKFQVHSVSADPYGGEYGTVSAGTFGPAGQVVSYQKYYNRRPWTEKDTEISKSCQGYNFFMSDALAPYILQVPYAANGEPQGNAMNNFEPFVTHSWLRGTSLDGAHGTWATNLPGGPQGTLHPGMSHATWAHGFLGQKVGGYMTTQDLTTDVYVVADALGTLIQTHHLVREGATGNVLYPSLNGFKENHEGITEYESSRHTWY